MGYCSDKAFIVLGFRLIETWPTAKEVNGFVRRLGVPEGYLTGSAFRFNTFVKSYGQPEAILRDVNILASGDLVPLALFQNGVAWTGSSLTDPTNGIGAYNFGVCRGEAPPAGAYIPFLGREGTDTKIGQISWSTNEGKPIDPGTPKFNKGSQIAAHLKVTLAPGPHREVPFFWVWEFSAGRTGQAVSRTAGGPAPTEITLAAELNPDLQPLCQACRLAFYVGTPQSFYRLGEARFAIEE